MSEKENLECCGIKFKSKKEFEEHEKTHHHHENF